MIWLLTLNTVVSIFFLNHAYPKNRGKGVFFSFSGQSADRVFIKRGILKTASAFFIKEGLGGV